MPCRDGRDEESAYTNYQQSEINRLYKEIKFLEAALCMAIRANKGDGEYDYTEAGVSPAEFNNWWHHHQTIDATRREKEKAEKERLKAIEKALSKLTPAERKLIGK